MDNTVFFSIIIPTLNEEECLPKLLSNLVSQKEKNFEVLVVDGSSKDKTEEKALEFVKVLDLKFYKNPRNNVAFQRNFGASHAKGSYLIFLDADSNIRASFTKALERYILKKKGLVLIPSLVPDEKSPQADISFKFANFLVEFSQNIGKPFSAGGNMVWEKNFFNLVGGFDDKLFIAEDHNLIQRANSWGVKAKFLKDIKVTFSLRRSRREGQLALFYKYLVSTAYLLIRGNIKKKIYQYEMGGVDKDKFKKEDYLIQIKKFFKQYLD